MRIKVPKVKIKKKHVPMFEPKGISTVAIVINVGNEDNFVNNWSEPEKLKILQKSLKNKFLIRIFPEIKRGIEIKILLEKQSIQNSTPVFLGFRT